ncbi:DNA-directed RNA polymerase subunit E' [Caldisphaera lagunensis DSM 15908]|uniref:DNA-directed RNA polymerase subunit Rpo7 n=1 Tax=Caldisphaera lagunensis (strain DSM 15908 / JCM 11604 / ANMR 0165 / IC-154) TaxID=1056495 RepID=L0A8S8_CALLD|nr:DNA-directed RNA polymerase [Caldisphaera lagunensis]AFZ70251.1 DNA-directed RNA polymerase subunit E' [Caldisphaera lagunensis DSM 15908]
MYAQYTLHEWVGVSPDVAFTENLKKAVIETLRSELEGQADPDLGIIIAVLDAEIEGDGILLSEDPNIYFPVKYTLISYEPMQLEVSKGIVRDARDFGLFVSLGPIDGFVHRSQIMDEDIEYIQERRGFKGKETGRLIEAGDIVNVRITQISKTSKKSGLYRIGLTMRQPYLGKEEWYKANKEQKTENEQK